MGNTENFDEGDTQVAPEGEFKASKLTKKEIKMLRQIKLATELVMLEDKGLLEELAKH